VTAAWAFSFYLQEISLLVPLKKLKKWQYFKPPKSKLKYKNQMEWRLKLKLANLIVQKGNSLANPIVRRGDSLLQRVR
jgi:hypothetical protein